MVHNVTVAAVDAFGNVTPGYRGTISFNSSDLQALLPPNYAFTTADAGAFTFFSGGLNLLPLAVSDLGSTATINLTDAGGAGDRFIHRGTPGDGTFAITTVPGTSLTIDAGTPIVSTGIELFSLDGQGGSDTMTFLGSAVVENYTFNNQGGHVQMLRDVDAVNVETA